LSSPPEFPQKKSKNDWDFSFRPRTKLLCPATLVASESMRALPGHKRRFFARTSDRRMGNECDWESALKERFETKWFIGDFRCPDCGNAMRIGTDVTCSVCDYRKTLQPPVDLRPSRPRAVKVELKTVISPVPNEVLGRANIDPPQVTYDGPPA